MAFIKAFTNGGDGDSTSNALLLYDCTQNSVGAMSSYNPDVLEYVSGSFKANYNSASDITFKSKIDGTVVIDVLQASKPQFILNGTDKIPSGGTSHTTVAIAKGDTIQWKAPTYWSVSVVYVQ